jgi:hypothetical protein
MAGLPSAKALEASDILAFSTGPLVLRPHLTVGEQFTDNILYNSRAQLSDFITITRPNLEVWLGRVGSENFLSADYTLSHTHYAQHPGFDSLDHAVSLSETLRGNRLSADGTYEFGYLGGVYGGYSSFVQAATTQSQSATRLSLNLDQKVAYGLSEKTGIYIRGTYTALDFRDRVAFLDTETTRGTLGFSYKALRKTSFFGEVYYSQGAAGPNDPAVAKGPHVDFVGGFIGVEGTFTSKMKGSVKAGYEQAEAAGGRSKTQSPVVELSLTEEFSDKTALSLNYSRHSSLSVQTSGQTVVTDYATLRLDQTLGTRGRFRVKSALGYGRNDFGDSGPLKGRTDNYLRATLDVAYSFKLWLTAGIGYEFEKLMTASRLNVDYSVNRVTLSLSIGY